MKLLKICAAIVAAAAFIPAATYAQFSEIGLHTRLSDMGNAEANGGGDTSLIGINAAGINNWGINQWDLSSVAGVTSPKSHLLSDIMQALQTATTDRR